MKAAIGRADLLRALARVDGSRADTLAGLLGFEVKAQPLPPREPAHPAPTPEPIHVPIDGLYRDPAPEPAITASVPLRPIQFWRVVSVEHHDEGSDLPKPILPDDLALLEHGATAGASPVAPSLRSWSRLWPELHGALAGHVSSRTIDVEALVASWSAGRVIGRLPRTRRRAWPARLTVVVDRDTRLLPFWRDQDEVVGRLRRVCGRQGLRVVPPTSAPNVAEPVLTLSDLGHYGSAADRQAWLKRGRVWRSAGCDIRALIPVPPGRWSPGVTSAWRARPWERRRTDGGSAEDPFDPAVRTARAERLLRLVSSTQRIELGLLRAVRALLPAGEADVGTEADAYLHEAVKGGHAVAMSLSREASARFRAELTLEDEALIRRVGELVHRWHLGLPPEIWHEDVLALAADPRSHAWLEPHLARAEQFADRLARIAVAPGEVPDRRTQAAIEAWFRRFERRIPVSTWRDPRFGRSLATVWAFVHRNDGTAEVPPGAAAGAARWLADPNAEQRVVEVRQVGRELRLVPGSARWPASAEPGSPLLVIESRSRAMVFEFDPTKEGARIEVGSAGAELDSLVAPGRGRVLMHTARATYGLEILHRPEWASAMGRDRFGLWVEIDVRGVTARLRWIPPGRFEMGSPESEAGRWDAAEGPVHTVTLSHGFWLGETPVTQLLWEAVLSTNPSGFVSRDRPVDNVSWDDCQEFLRALGRHDDVWGLDARLPTEAEWEYACRAGTTAATFAGDLEIRGKNDAPLLDSIAWYGGNSGIDFELANGSDSSDLPNKQHPHTKAGSHPVGRKAANPWGLYDMLGNVWEWCADWHGPYDSGPATDPTGPTVGSSRVLRGGSWYSVAQGVRAAGRGAGSPAARHDSFGFRLARGPAAQVPGTGQPAEPAGTAGRASSRASGRAGAGRDERAARPTRRKRGS